LDRINSPWDVFLTQKGDRDRRRRHHKIPSAYPRRIRESVAMVSWDETHLQWLPRFSHCTSHGHPYFLAISWNSCSNGLHTNYSSLLITCSSIHGATGMS
jgi:hypothetical protein